MDPLVASGAHRVQMLVCAYVCARFCSVAFGGSPSGSSAAVLAPLRTSCSSAPRLHSADMAGTGRVSAAAKAKAAAAATKSSAEKRPAPQGRASSSKNADADESGTMMQKRHETKKARRQLGRRDTDEAVDRSLQAHFGHLPRTSWDALKVNELSLRHRVLKDMRECRGKPSRLGTTYWRRLREEYDVENALGHMKPATANEPVAPELADACYQATHTNPALRTVEPLLGYLRYAGKMNMTELVAPRP